MCAPELSDPFTLESVKPVCECATTKAIVSYLRKQSWFIDTDLFRSKRLQNISKRNLTLLIQTLPEIPRAQTAADFSKVYSFLSGKRDNFACLLKYLQEIGKKDLSKLAGLRPFDQVLYILTNFTTDFYQCYYICYPYEESKMWSIRRDYYKPSTALNNNLTWGTICKLKNAVQTLFKQELRGNHLKKMVNEVDNKIHISFYLENYPQFLPVFDHGKLKQKYLNPAFHVHFVIDKQKKLVTVYTDAQNKQQDLHVIIAKVVFNKKITKYGKHSEFFNPQLFLQQLITGQSLTPPVWLNSKIYGLYVNQITLINLFLSYSEITINTKQLTQKRFYEFNSNLIYELLKEQKDIFNSAKYLVKSIEFIALVNDPQLAEPVKKHFIINKQGQTNLGFSEIDEQIKDHLKAFSVISPQDCLPLLLRNFLNHLIAKLEHSTGAGGEIPLSPQDISRLSPEHLLLLETAHLIEKYPCFKFGWCNNCDSFGNITDNKDGNIFFCCLSCNNYEILSGSNAIQYFSKLTLISSFLKANLNLFSNVETIINHRLFYLGQREQTKYYLLIGIKQDDVTLVLRNLALNRHSYVFCLENNHSLKLPKSIVLINLSEQLVIINGKLALSLPEIYYQNSIASLGGIAKNEQKFGKAKEFVRAAFQEKINKIDKRTKKAICEEISLELQQHPELITNLSEDNLPDWVSKQVRKMKI